MNDDKIFVYCCNFLIDLKLKNSLTIKKGSVKNK